MSISGWDIKIKETSYSHLFSLSFHQIKSKTEHISQSKVALDKPGPRTTQNYVTLLLIT